ncbi:hypothetical protein IFVP69_C160001 [Vibrio parahaemolyticus]
MSVIFLSKSLNKLIVESFELQLDISSIKQHNESGVTKTSGFNIIRNYPWKFFQTQFLTIYNKLYL